MLDVPLKKSNKYRCLFFALLGKCRLFNVNEKILVGIDGNGFKTWGGGIDFIATITEALESTGKVQTYLLLDEMSAADKIFKSIKFFIKSGLNLCLTIENFQKYKYENREIIDGFRICTPNTKVVCYKTIANRFYNNLQKKQEQCLDENNVSIILPSIQCKKRNGSIARIGYIYDFQHKYYPDFFSKEVCEQRDREFGEQLSDNDYVIVNANEVKKDILKFYPNNRCKVIVLPFKPFQKVEVPANIDLKKYDLPNKYYVICNQFWLHKSHITAFEALDALYESGTTDIHIVCTGKMEDVRSENYIANLKEKVARMKCRENIHFLGYIPKNDQIGIMRNSIGLIQPTLFEGGPGGGATYNALGLGLPCLLSDIPVNREVVGYENVFFFEKENSKMLAELMLAHQNDSHVEEKDINIKLSKNKKEYGEFLLNVINSVINTGK